MECFGPILRVPRIFTSDNIVRRSGSVVATPIHYGRSRTSFGVPPRSRSSYGCMISDVGRDGCVVTRRVSPSPAGVRSFAGSTFSGGYSTSPTRQPLYAASGRSLSIEPLTTQWSSSRYEGMDRSASPTRRTHYHPRVSSMSRFARRDSLSQPYYTINAVGPAGHEIIMKRTSVSHPQIPLRVSPFSNSTLDYLPHGGKVLAESNIVSRRTSVQEDDFDGMPETYKRTSHYRSGPPRMGDKRQSRQEAFIKHSSINQPSLASGYGRTPSIAQTSKISSFALSPQRGSLSSLPPAPLRKISVVHKPATDNGPMSSVKVIELEGIQPHVNTNFEARVEKNSYPQRTELLKDLKKRTMDAKGRLDRHRDMLDRYLPVTLGPEPDVAFQIQNKYGELVDRLPFIERRTRPSDAVEDNEVKPTRVHIKPYTPSSVRFTGPLFNVRVPDSFTPTISETRKRARNVLCKVKGDPGYFSFH